MRAHDLCALAVPFALAAALAAGVVVTSHRNAPPQSIEVTAQDVFDLPGYVVTASPVPADTMVARSSDDATASTPTMRPGVGVTLIRR